MMKKKSINNNLISFIFNIACHFILFFWIFLNSFINYFKFLSSKKIKAQLFLRNV